MNDNFLRNREGNIIARVDGNTLRDGTGKIVAVYHPVEDITIDGAGIIVRHGDRQIRKIGEL